MIIARSPLRITLGGGGTDLKSYYSINEGFLISAAINKYVYITLHRTFQDFYILKYSEMEKGNDINEIKHPIIREALKLLDIKNRIEICSMADIPAGTGLGSSSSFTVALLNVLYTYQKHKITAGNLAEEACKIEIDVLKEPIGKQDQYIASYGGINCFNINKKGKVTVTPLDISNNTLLDLEDNLLLFFTGYSRAASAILKEQKERSEKKETDMIKNLDFVKDLAIKSKKALEENNLKKLAELMNVHWEYKKQRSKTMTNENIEKWYKIALKNGATGGKLIGAGGGGFLMFYAHDREKLRSVMKKSGLEEIRFSFDFEGSKILINEINLY